jgi:hypothetical protein
MPRIENFGHLAAQRFDLSQIFFTCTGMDQCLIQSYSDDFKVQKPFQYTTLASALAVTNLEKQLWNRHCVI